MEMLLRALPGPGMEMGLWNVPESPPRTQSGTEPWRVSQPCQKSLPRQDRTTGAGERGDEPEFQLRKERSQNSSCEEEKSQRR